jgi:hypothetical protein
MFYSAMYMRYRWEVLLQPRGSVFFTAFGRRVGGGPYTIGSISNPNDTISRVFGQYEFPYEATVHISNREQFFNSWLGFRRPIQSTGDETSVIDTFLPSDRGVQEETFHGWDREGNKHTYPG